MLILRKQLIFCIWCAKKKKKKKKKCLKQLHKMSLSFNIMNEISKMFS